MTSSLGRADSVTFFMRKRHGGNSGRTKAKAAGCARAASSGRSPTARQGFAVPLLAQSRQSAPTLGGMLWPGIPGKISRRCFCCERLRVYGERWRAHQLLELKSMDQPQLFMQPVLGSGRQWWIRWQAKQHVRAAHSCLLIRNLASIPALSPVPMKVDPSFGRGLLSFDREVARILEQQAQEAELDAEESTSLRPTRTKTPFPGSSSVSRLTPCNRSVVNVANV